MMGLVFIFVFILYLIVSLIVIWFSVRAARKRKIKGWKFGVPAALFMYLLVFWDHIPTKLMREHYCQTEAGLYVYMTPEQWLKENPGVAQTLTWKKLSDSERIKRGTVYHLNQRFDWKVYGEPLFLKLLFASKNTVVDRDTGEILVEKIDFTTNIKNISLGRVKLRDYKIWLAGNTCFKKEERDRWLYQDESFSTFRNKYEKISALEVME
jgi:hypothetical protein